MLGAGLRGGGGLCRCELSMTQVEVGRVLYAIERTVHLILSNVSQVIPHVTAFCQLCAQRNALPFILRISRVAVGVKFRAF